MNLRDVEDGDTVLHIAQISGSRTTQDLDGGPTITDVGYTHLSTDMSGIHMIHGVHSPITTGDGNGTISGAGTGFPDTDGLRHGFPGATVETITAGHH